MISLTPVAGSPPAAIGAAVPCLCPDAAARLTAGPLDDLPDYHPAYYSEPLPLPPRVYRRSPVLGRIAWPCWGLTRFAAGHVLVSASSLAGVEAQAGYDGRVWVTLDDGDGNPFALAMRIVGRRPLADPRAELEPGNDSGADLAWVVTLTDDRWDRAGKLYATASTGTPATWGDLLSEVLAAGGYTVSASTINATLALRTPAYDVPAAGWFARPAMAGRCALVLADAIAAQVNLRIAVAADGSVEVQGIDRASDVWDDWLTANGDRSGSGGMVDAELSKTIPLTLHLAPSGSATELTRTLATGTYGDLSASVQAGTTGNHADRFAADVDEWLRATTADMTGTGYWPVPASAVPCEVGWDGATGTSWVCDGPAWWPWPLSGYVPAAATGGSLATVNSDATDSVTATTKITASLPDGLEFVATGTEQAIKGIDSSRTQRGMVNLSLQKWKGRKDSFTTSVAGAIPSEPFPTATVQGAGFNVAGAEDFDGDASGNLPTTVQLFIPHMWYDTESGDRSGGGTRYGGFVAMGSVASTTSFEPYLEISTSVLTGGGVVDAQNTLTSVTLQGGTVWAGHPLRNYPASAINAAGGYFGVVRNIAGTQYNLQGLDSSLTPFHTGVFFGGILVDRTAATTATPLGTDEVVFLRSGTTYRCTIAALKALLDTL